MARPKGKGYIAPYKNVVMATQAELPPPLTPEQLEESRKRFALAEQERQAEEKSAERLATTPIPTAKVLTAMELRSRAIHLMNERGYDPIRELVKIANNNMTDQDTRIKIHMHLAKYVYPEQKAVDLNVQGDLNLTVNVVKFSTANGQQLAPNREAIPVRAVEVAS